MNGSLNKSQTAAQDDNETLADWARQMKISDLEMGRYGLEKATGDVNKPMQEMPPWVFDNHFEGLPPFDPNAELVRLGLEMENILTEIDRLPPLPASALLTSQSVEQREESEEALVAMLYDKFTEQQQQNPSSAQRRNKPKQSE